MPLERASAAIPFNAVLLDSLAQEVYIISSGAAPVSPAIDTVISSIRSLAAFPASCVEFGFPKNSRSVSQKHRSTSSETGVFAE